jgi:alpha/beta superfamily hydrolase
MVTTKAVDFPGPAGRLEGILMLPEKRPVAAGIICHAHPLFGGTMHMKVVYHAARALQRQGVAALRLNFRGVGRSEGTHDNGKGEQEDVRAALDELERLFPGIPIVLGGFSFGSVVALRLGVRDPHVLALFALGFPITMVPDTSFLDNCRKPRLFVQGENDNFGGRSTIEELVGRLPEPRSLIIVRGGDHLFAEHLIEVEQSVASWIAVALGD